jgi:alpha-ketoglutarate-dependent 2,4-dichlorophenoxyacetate dioxygenase
MYVNQSKNDCLRKLVAIMVIEGVGYSRMMDEKRGGEAQAGWRAAHCPICHTLAFVYGVALSWRWAVMRLISLGPRFAAEVRGVDLIDVATDDAAYCAVREAFEEHSVILFRNQETSDDVQVAFSRAFGPLERTKVGSRGAGTFYVHSTNVAADATLVAETDRQALANRANQLWHTDSSFKATPALASVLSARTIPEDGGETEFVSTRLAWDRLSDEQREELRDLVVVHSYATSRDQIDPALMTQVERAALPAVRWRLIWRNPANARDALYIASHAEAIEGMDEGRSRALLARLIDEATQSSHVYSHQWRTGDVILWDNRTTMHRGRPWPGTQARLMVRTTISARDIDGLDQVRPN